MNQLELPAGAGTVVVRVLVNSASPDFREGLELVLPYFEHLGVPYVLHDILHTPLPADLQSDALIVVAHSRLDARGRRLGAGVIERLHAAVAAGAGLVTFDPALAPAIEQQQGTRSAAEIVVTPASHPITAGHATPETIQLVNQLTLPVLSGGEALLQAGDTPLLLAATYGRGRVVTWASARWASARVLGPLAGLDDVLWRALAWAARKPFVMRGLAPLVAMRVDDVVAGGRRWDAAPLAWAQAAARIGFKPWMGLFLANLDDQAIGEIRALIEAGQGTAFPHAFGRPPRDDAAPLFYTPDVMPPRSSRYDEFIYFDHQHARPWNDAEAQRGLAAVDAWYARHAPLPIARYAVPHWYEFGANTVRHVADRWGCDMLGIVQDTDSALTNTTPWLKLGPFRRYERPGTSLFDPARGGDRPIYYADFVTIAGRRLFNCLTEIRDDAGYEWAPDANIAATVGRGVRQLRRALDSQALAVLFTHETDFITAIPPTVWEQELSAIHAGIAGYNPRYVTLDQGAQIVRATRTSHITQVTSAHGSQTATIELSGHADIATTCSLFADDTLEAVYVDVPAFEGSTIVRAEW